MKFVALVSGGKDSLYAIWQCLQQGHELVAAVHLSAPAPTSSSTLEEEEEEENDKSPATTTDHQHPPPVVVEESYMYQSAASNVVAQQIQDCLGVPCLVYPRRGTSQQISLVYDDIDDMDETTTEVDNINGDDSDEVQDLHRALLLIQTQFPQVQAVCCGALASTYQRVRVEHVVCRRLQWQSLAYLWRQQPATALLHTLLTQTQMNAILVHTASPPGLQPRLHLGRSLHELESTLFPKLYEKYGFHVCGEGGEYETLVLNIPGLFQRRIVLDETRIIEHEDGVGMLQILTFHTEPNPEKDSAPWLERVTQPDGSVTLRKKERNTNGDDQREMAVLAGKDTTCPGDTTQSPLSETMDDRMATTTITSSIGTPTSTRPRHTETRNSSTIHCLPHVRRLSGGFWSVSEIATTATTIMATTTNSDDDRDNPDKEVIRQALHIFAILQQILDALHCTPQDILLVHLYLPKMAHFALINQHYRQFFGVLLPPSRCTVASSRTTRIVLDCCGQCGSGAYLRAPLQPPRPPPQAMVEVDNDPTTTTTGANENNNYTAAALANVTTPLRQVLHVQSLSHWAPVCVGPYSQVNTLRNSLHFLAGQIGLQPATMTFGPSATTVLTQQLEQCWTNVAAIVDAVNQTSLSQCAMSCLLYVTTTGLSLSPIEVVGEPREDIWQQIQSICTEQWKDNGGVVPGAIDGTTTSSSTATNHNGYEDEETRLAMEGIDVAIPTTTTFKPLIALVVTVPELPVGALTEVELVAATRPAVECLDIVDHCHNSHCEILSRLWDLTPVDDTIDWDTGHDFSLDKNAGNENDPHATLQIQSYVRTLGSTGEASFGLVTASVASNHPNVDAAFVLRRMLESLRRTHLDVRHVLHLRLYYCMDQTTTNNNRDDNDHGMRLRLALQAAMGCVFEETCWPASTVIPVHGLRVCWLGGEPSTVSEPAPEKKTTTTSTTVPNKNDVQPFLALQAIALDPVHLEQSMWIRHGRN